ncbi:uncharacterized protein LOC126971863 isoform X2 [Leptidea sinapis]|uniref:uncharacterized protein LOC126971863 isoform X2 n=1 Tax=Leptidea sinapis TaxID=189913 RepID=UPI0021205AFB|nr:uncharacterized protein LOC126971863 isoform X2 [Leptidea sinapis]
MKMFIIISAAFLQVTWCYGYPGARPQGVGVYAYQDSAGNRYGGSYGLDGKQIDHVVDPYSAPLLSSFADIATFFPNYITNYDNLLQEVRRYLSGFRPLRPLSSRPFGFKRFPTFGPPNFFGGGFDVMSHPNSAFASAVAGPGYSHQTAAINPESEAMRNIDVTNRFNEPSGGNNKFYSVSSSSYSSSSNLDGQVKNLRGAETTVNNNGKVTKYRVQN